MLKKIPFRSGACDIVYSRQEEFGGSGIRAGFKEIKHLWGAHLLDRRRCHQ
jgi:hypothetical protein